MSNFYPDKTNMSNLMQNLPMCCKPEQNLPMSGGLDFYEKFTTLKEAQNISDHIPVYFYFELK